MQPVSPVIKAAEDLCQITYGVDQPQYSPLPVVRTANAVMSRWSLSDEERAYIAGGGDLFIMVLNFGGPLQPLRPVAKPPDAAMKELIELE
jgi:hypothetical protein